MNIFQPKKSINLGKSLKIRIVLKLFFFFNESGSDDFTSEFYQTVTEQRLIQTHSETGKKGKFSPIHVMSPP